jgi:GTP-binding protein HflX
VVDASAYDPADQIAAVREVLEEIGGDRIPELLCFNKRDRAPKAADRLVDRNPGSVAISARTGDGVDVLLRTIGDRLRALADVVELLIPYERGDLLAAVHREGEVTSESHEEGGIRVRARLDAAGQARFDEVRLGR